MKYKKSKKQLIMTIVLLLSLVLITVGISYAFFTYIRQGSTENTITTGNLTFVYDEKNQSGNGIKLSNALPVSDEIGKQQIGSNNVFDFQVIATTQGVPIYYEVLAEKGEESTLPEEVVKVYLTTVDGIEETEVDNTLINNQVTAFNQLPVSQLVEYSGDKTLYQGMVSEGQENYTKQFRLRMWLSEEAMGVTNGEWNYNNQTFSLKVNVYASNEVLSDSKKLYTDTTGANLPKLVEGMIPVSYDGSKWVKADLYDEWYDYETQEWANAVTVTEQNRETYMNAEPGTEISMDDINTMWVWIPRYEYQFTNLGDQYAGGTADKPGEIKVNFLSGVTTEASDASNYKIHPAFTFGKEELTGLWYAKFETTGTLATSCTDTTCDTSQVTIKPGKNALINQSISSYFYMARSMQLNNSNTFGFRSYIGDLHMSKNSEWGAVAYLSQSKYGKYGNSNYEGVNKEIYQNKSKQCITGSSNGTPSTDSTNPQVSYDTPYSGYGASTTGTIYGVYDMSGGVWDAVMGIYNKNLNQSGFVNMPESKYYDLYTTENFSTACNGDICYGHALSETSAWYADRILFASFNHPFLYRGGYHNNGADVGVFSSIVGSSNSVFSPRLSIAP